MIHDLGIIMLVAGATSLLSKWLKQPVVLGYIVAGLLAGPYVCGSSWVNVESAETWGQVGVIFLLFTLGLEFSFKKLLQMGSTAFIGALTIVIGMMGSGFMLGHLLGWSNINSLFLGGMLCMSSTTIVFKALDDLGLRQQKFAGICFGILVVEDLFAVVLMVLLASIAVNQQFNGGEMIAQVFKLVAYLLFWFVAGITLIPSLLKICRKHLNDETMTIVACGLCLGMVLIAKMAGFSEALGAFVMGSILAETVECERIEKLMSPIKNLFGAIFFVSVGMMISPATLVEYWLPISVITVTVILGQIIFASLGITLSGQPLKLAMQSAFALTQVGEFAFIIAQFGESIGVTEKFLYPVVVAVSVITTFLTPYTIRLAEPAYGLIERILPAQALKNINKLSQNKSTFVQESLLTQLIKKCSLTVLIYGIISVFIIAFYQKIISVPVINMVNSFVPIQWEWVGKMTSMWLLLIIIAPFVFKLVTGQFNAEEATKLRHDESFQRAPLLTLFVIRVILGMVLIVFCVNQYFHLTTLILIISAIIIVLAILFSNKVDKRSVYIEQHFMENLSAREREQEKIRPVKRELEAAFLNYNLHLADFELNPESEFCGRRLAQLNFRQTCGVNVVRIIRGGININAPSGRETIYPHDRIVVAGSDEQILTFQQKLSDANRADVSFTERHTLMSLELLQIQPEMPFCEHTLNEFRHGGGTVQCVVLGIEHNGVTTMNPAPETILAEGDTLIIAGEKEQIKQLLPM